MHHKKKCIFLGYKKEKTNLIQFLKTKNYDVVHINREMTIKEATSAEIIISFGYRILIKKEIIKHLKRPALNLHMSYLPYNRGAHPNFWSFVDNTPKGITIHEIAESTGSGNILFQKKYNLNSKLKKYSTFRKSYNFLFSELENLFIKNFDKINLNTYKSIKQKGPSSFHLKSSLPKSLVSWDMNIEEFKNINKNKANFTLGICNAETSSACLFKNDILVGAVSEERFSRKKYDNSFPNKSIEFLLKNSNIKLKNIDHIAYSWVKNFNPRLKKKYENRLNDCKKIGKKSYTIFKERIKTEIKQDLYNGKEFNKWAKKKLTKIQNKKISKFYHHEAHASSAAFFSPFNNGLVLTSDARGDFESLTLWLFNRKNKNALTKIYSSTSSDSLGFFYGRITGLLGFKPMKHEGKITGLAAHGNPSRARNFIKSMITVKNGEVVASLGDFYRPFFSNYSNKLIKKIKKFSREDIAAAAQEHLEWCLCKILKYYFKSLKLKPMPLMLAGGTFGNVKATQSLKELNFVTKVFVQPQMGDGGLCLGAGALSLHSRGSNIKPLTNVYLGPNVIINNFKYYKNKYLNYNFVKVNNVPNKVCEDLKNNQVIGFARGKMEFGPRALCNRSIIYRTNDKTINDWLNKRMNRTEFMPFAPIIRNNTARKAFIKYKDNDPTLNFMTSTINCSKEFEKKCPAVTHVDRTARPQIIYKSTDPVFWQILLKWEKISGEMALVNTSFNAHEQPIICNETESIEALKSGMIDVLYINNIRIIKNTS